MTRSRQNLFRAAVGVLAAGSAVGIFLILGAQFSRMTAAGPAARAPVPVLPEPLLVVGLIAFGLAAVVSIVWLVVVSTRDGSAPRPRKDRRQLFAIAGTLVSSFLVLYLLVAFAASFIRVEEDEPVELPRSEGDGELVEEELQAPFVEEDEPLPESGESDDRSGVSLLVAAGLFALVAGFVGVRAYRRYAARPEATETEALERLSADLHATSARGLARMLEEPDDRLAVIAAYALVENTLERHGYPRVSSRTPVEFMRATLRELESVPGEALLSLTELYEVARFSEHPVGPRARAAAVASLERIGEALRGAGVRGRHDTGADPGATGGR